MVHLFFFTGYLFHLVDRGFDPSGKHAFLSFVSHSGDNPVEAPAHHHRSNADYGKGNQRLLPRLEIQGTGDWPDHGEDDGGTQDPGQPEGRAPPHDRLRWLVWFDHTGEQEYRRDNDDD
jgi:hypothetical protein